MNERKKQKNDMRMYLKVKEWKGIRADSDWEPEGTPSSVLLTTFRLTLITKKGVGTLCQPLAMRKFANYVKLKIAIKTFICQGGGGVCTGSQLKLLP